MGPARLAPIAMLAALVVTACDTGATATVQEAAGRYQPVSDRYQAAIGTAAKGIEATHPGAAAIASAMSAMAQATHQFIGDVRQIQFPDSIKGDVTTIEDDSQTLANADLLIVNEASAPVATDVATWNKLDSRWRADDKQLRTDLGLPIPDFDNH